MGFPGRRRLPVGGQKNDFIGDSKLLQNTSLELSVNGHLFSIGIFGDF